MHDDASLPDDRAVPGDAPPPDGLASEDTASDGAAPDGVAAADAFDPALFGKDDTPGLVDVVPVREGSDRGPAMVRLYRRDAQGRLVAEDDRVFPFFFLSDAALLDGHPKTYKIQTLGGDAFFRHLVVFNTWRAYYDALRHLDTATESRDRRPDEVYRVGSPAQQYLTQTGRTLFKGMAFDDLHRLQLDLEVYSAQGFPSAERPSDEIIIVALSDNRGWQKLLHSKDDGDEAALLRRALAEIAVRDPDVIEGHNCLLPGTSVWTPGGPVRVEDGPGPQVLGATGVQQASAFSARPYGGTAVRLAVERSAALATTADHPHLVASRSGTRWTPAGEVQKGDYLAAPRRLSVDVQDDGLAEDDYYAAGLLWSDGHLPANANVLWISNTCPDLLAWARAYFGPACFEKAPVQREPHHAPLVRVCLTSPERRARMTALGVPVGDKNAAEVRFERVLRAPEAKALAFLRGVVDGDGHVRPSHLHIATANRSFRRVLAFLCRRFGWQTSENDGGVLVYPTGDSVDAYDRLVQGLVSPRKRLCFDRSRAVRDDVPPEVATRLKPFFRAPGGRRKADWRPGYADVPLPRSTVNYLLNGRTRLSRAHAAVLRAAVEARVAAAPAAVQEQWAEARRFVDGLLALSWMYVREVHRFPYEGPVYNATTQDHTYVAEGLLTHNCYAFDLPYFETRCALHGIPFALGRDGSLPRSFPAQMRFAERSIEYPAYEIAGRHVVDTLFQAMSYDVTKRSLPGYGLKAVARYFGFAPEGRTYVDGDQIGHVWKTDPDRLLAYALDDVIETERIARHLSGATFFLTQMLPMPYGQAARTGPAAKIEALFVREYLRRRQSFPKPQWGSQAVGGYTDVFVTGVVGPVVYADVESLYPSIMLSYGIQPASDTLGLFPGLLRRLTALRLDTKRAARAALDAGERSSLDARQASYKILINCFSDDTDLLTEHGLRRVSDVRVGDRVYSLDPATGRTALRPVTRVYHQPRYCGPMVQIRHPQVDLLVTPNHRMILDDGQGGGTFEEAGTWLADRRRRRIAPRSPCDGRDDPTLDLRALADDLGVAYDRAHADATGRLRTPPTGVGRKGAACPAVWPADAFFAFAGWYLSEGHIAEASARRYPNGHQRGANRVVCLAQKSGPGMAAIPALLDCLGLAYSRTTNGFTLPGRFLAELCAGLFGNGSRAKTLPPWVFAYSGHALLPLWEAMMAGDGDASGQRYTTQSDALAHAFVQLSHHVGRFARVSGFDGSHRIAVGHASRPAPVVKAEHRQEVAYDGPLTCVEVAGTHTVLAGRNGRLAWTGQSFYGYLGFGFGTFNDFAEADRVAATGQELLRRIIRALVDQGATVVEVDTDGVLFVPPPGVSKADEQAFVVALNAHLPEGIRIAYEGRAEKMLSYKKKNYALLEDGGTVKVKGSSLVSRSIERFGREFVAAAIRLLLDEDVDGLHRLYVRTREAILARDWRGVESFSRTETLKDTPEQYRQDVASGKRTRAAAYELALAQAEETGLPVRVGDRVSYYVTGTTANVTTFESARLARFWRPDAPDENTAYYLKRLDEFARKFDVFFSEPDFARVFSPPDLFGFDARGIRLVVTRTPPDAAAGDVPF